MPKYPTEYFRSIDHLCEMIEKVTGGWDTVWYRGNCSSRYELLPYIFRDKRLSGREGYISVEFRRRARSLNLDLTDQFNCLCSMQHYGLPTRLLDWTESLSVALYFCIRTKDFSSFSPTIWVLDPFELYKLSSKEEIIPISKHDNVTANADIAFDDDPEVHKKQRTKYPLPVLPDLNSPRLAAQNGVFTIHGMEARSIETAVPKPFQKSLIKFVADEGQIANILRTIELVKPSHHSVYPDVEGILNYVV